jgi:LmbE family N-acetylglucosaminyl deacetylase
MKPISRLPGKTTDVVAQKVLVIAPHADDDVLGCGGLLAKLAARGAAIHVLFLTDSSGGDEVTEHQQQYAERRRYEARAALELLGITSIEHLDLPDGRLDQFMGLAAGAIERTLIEVRPELLLAVSPLEVTSDHQAAFAALHRTLSGLRGGGELDAAVAELKILLYEINHPGYPDVLVDVSAEIQALTEAIKKHSSQLDLHNYLKAAIGIRRYRTLSLPTSVTAAEGFRELRAADFVTHSVAGMIRALGGCPAIHERAEGPRISVVVPGDRPSCCARLSPAWPPAATATCRWCWSTTVARPELHRLPVRARRSSDLPTTSAGRRPLVRGSRRRPATTSRSSTTMTSPSRAPDDPRRPRVGRGPASSTPTPPSGSTKPTPPAAGARTAAACPTAATSTPTSCCSTTTSPSTPLIDVRLDQAGPSTRAGSSRTGLC